MKTEPETQLADWVLITWTKHVAMLLLQSIVKSEFFYQN